VKRHIKPRTLRERQRAQEIAESWSWRDAHGSNVMLVDHTSGEHSEWVVTREDGKRRRIAKKLRH